MKRIDLTGKRFGKLVVLWPAGYSNRKQIVWLCQCDCGNYHPARGYHLRGGLINSCGCLRSTVPQINGQFRHGHSVRGRVTVEYRTWRHMHSRCEDPNDNEFKNYGARGISVCSRWKTYENFFADMGRRPLGPPRQFSIERINNDGNYEPSNCKWATAKEQTRNRRRKCS